ncbi:phosphatase PAP2 family protein [Oleiharenicola lentus]|uniref:phosphatase PAP2 family protein n=1 Tax=Oleiharenicola lentus TaxID=2508720 RepID=UPI003F6679D5
MTVFFAAYFYVLNHPRGTVAIMPLTWLDELIAFQPLALVPYVSLWIYVSLAPGLTKTLRELIIYGLASLSVAICGLAVFYFFPTAVPAASIDWAAHPGFALLKSADAAGNACPSLHVAFAIFTACRFGNYFAVFGVNRTLAAINWLWAMAIVYSTLATKQHVAVDAAAGALLGFAGEWVHQRIAATWRS